MSCDKVEQVFLLNFENSNNVKEITQRINKFNLNLEYEVKSLSNMKNAYLVTIQGNVCDYDQLKHYLRWGNWTGEFKIDKYYDSDFIRMILSQILTDSTDVYFKNYHDKYTGSSNTIGIKFSYKRKTYYDYNEIKKFQLQFDNLIKSNISYNEKYEHIFLLKNKYEEDVSKLINKFNPELKYTIKPIQLDAREHVFLVTMQDKEIDPKQLKYYLNNYGSWIGEFIIDKYYDCKFLEEILDQFLIDSTDIYIKSYNYNVQGSWNSISFEYKRKIYYDYDEIDKLQKKFDEIIKLCTISTMEITINTTSQYIKEYLDKIINGEKQYDKIKIMKKKDEIILLY